MKAFTLLDIQIMFGEVMQMREMVHLNFDFSLSDTSFIWSSQKNYMVGLSCKVEYVQHCLNFFMHFIEEIYSTFVFRKRTTKVSIDTSYVIVDNSTEGVTRLIKKTNKNNYYGARRNKDIKLYMKSHKLKL